MAVEEVRARSARRRAGPRCVPGSGPGQALNQVQDDGEDGGDCACLGRCGVRERSGRAR